MQTNMISKIVGEINKKGQKVDGVIQRSYNPLVNDAVQFFVYSGNRLSHIVSSYRDPIHSRQQIYNQNTIMDSILKSVQDTPIRENILFSTWIVDLPGGCFRIQEFKEKGFWLQGSKCDLSNLQKYLDISSNWIVAFQEVTKAAIRPVPPLGIRERIRGEIDNWKSIYSHESDIVSLLSLLESQIEVINTPMLLAMHHGDYCYWNCFIDTTGIYRVIDWEFARISEWVVIDFITNLLVVWMALRKNRVIKKAPQAFFSPINAKDVLVTQKLLQLKSLHGFSINEIKFYFVYVFTRLFFRKERPASRIYWEPFLPDMIPILHSLHSANDY